MLRPPQATTTPQTHSNKAHALPSPAIRKNFHKVSRRSGSASISCTSYLSPNNHASSWLIPMSGGSNSRSLSTTKSSPQIA